MFNFVPLRRPASFVALLLLALPPARTQNPPQPAPAQLDSRPQSSSVWERVSRSVIVFMTDFGIANDAAAICRAVIYRIAPSVRIDDVSHTVTPYSIADGARFLAGVTPYYGRGAIFLVVIDPGVGSGRKAVIVKTKRGQYFVLPDNGLMTLVAARDGVAGIREITNPAWMIGDKLSSTFHGRDVFSPAAAHLARGEDWRAAGPLVASLVQLDLPKPLLDAEGITGQVIALDDPFGNLITNISAEDFRKLGYTLGDVLHIRIGDRPLEVPFVRTFSDVSTGKPLAYIDSRGHFGLAVSHGNFSEVYVVKPPATLIISRKTP